MKERQTEYLLGSRRIDEGLSRLPPAAQVGVFLTVFAVAYGISAAYCNIRGRLDRAFREDLFRKRLSSCATEDGKPFTLFWSARQRREAMEAAQRFSLIGDTT